MAEIDSQTDAAFSAANDWSKQVLTLSTGILAATISLGDTLFGQLSGFEKALLWISWGLYVLAILFGILVLMALTGTMGQDAAPTAKDIYAKNTTRPALAQFGTFLLATVVLAVFGGFTVGNPDKPASTKDSAPPIFARL
jgi:hypothetical protein